MPKTILYMAISSDGFIADTKDKTPWSEEEWIVFQEFIKSCDCILLGKRTYKIMQDQNEFVEGPEYIVVTTDNELNTNGLKKIVVESKKDMPHCSKIGVIGGAELNYRLAKLGLIDEVILDIESVKLHHGIKLFGDHEVPIKMKLMNSKVIGPHTTQKHYKVMYSTEAQVQQS